MHCPNRKLSLRLFDNIKNILSLIKIRNNIGWLMQLQQLSLKYSKMKTNSV